MTGKDVKIVEDGPLVKLAVPADTHHLFCKNCLEMYKKNMYQDNHIMIMFEKDCMDGTITNEYGKTSVMSSMMPLLKAWAAFIDYFTGVQTTFTIVSSKDMSDTKPLASVTIDHSDFMKKDKTRISKRLVQMSIVNKPFKWAAQSYAFMSSEAYVVFKASHLLPLKPEEALTFMVHEFTSHRFDTNQKHSAVTDHKKYWATRYENRGHYGGKSHPFEDTEHCATDRKSKTDRNAIGCMNGFIDKGYANFINALPFFKKWYDDHSSDPLTMFDLTSVKPSTTPPRKVKVKVKKTPPIPPPPTTPPVTPLVTPPVTPPPPPPPPPTLPAAYVAATPKIPEPADIEEVVEV